MTQPSQPHQFADRLLGLAMLLLAIAYVYGAQKFDEPFGMAETIGPEVFPTIIGSILGLTGLWLIIKPQESQQWPTIGLWINIVLILLALILFAFFLEKAGFIITATLFSFFISWRMGAKILPAFVIAVIYSIGLFVLFNYGLGLALPSGWLGGLI